MSANKITVNDTIIVSIVFLIITFHTQMHIQWFELTPLQIVLSITIIFIAYSIKGLSGFGSGLIAIPLISVLLMISGLMLIVKSISADTI